MRLVSPYLLLFGAGLTVCSLLIIRHACRTPPVRSTGSERTPSPHRKTPTADQARSEIRLVAGLRCRRGREAKQRLPDKLRREELRQRPQEGRN